MSELFAERRRALEEEFFARQNAELLEAMRASAETDQRKADLRKITGIEDDRILQHLIDAGMTPATLTATALVPLVAVAWADGRLEEGERTQVLRYARTLDMSDEANALLAHWLEAPPEPGLFDTWAEYVTSILPALDPAAREQLRSSTRARAEAVADAAAGEPYGVGRRISDEERRVLDLIEAALHT